jgi:hypothetical protein
MLATLTELPIRLPPGGEASFFRRVIDPLRDYLTIA